MHWIDQNWPDWMYKRLRETWAQLRIEQQASMSRYTSFRIGGPAPLLIFPENADQVRKVLGLANACGKEIAVVGKGTNLLVKDEGVDRPVLRMTEMRALRFLDETTLEAQAGISLAALATAACRAGLTGLEFAHGIPGTLGGAVMMNAGAYDGEMKQVITGVTALSLKPPYRAVTFTAEECDFGYRHSVFESGEWLVLSAVIKLQKGREEEIRAKMDELAARRKQSQPLEYASAGSTFKRPEGYYAGTLIDQTGLKGLRCGDAQVSEKHAGFIINTGKATAADVLELIEQVQKAVQQRHGVRLEPEVRLLG